MSSLSDAQLWTAAPSSQRCAYAMDKGAAGDLTSPSSVRGSQKYQLLVRPTGTLRGYYGFRRRKVTVTHTDHLVGYSQARDNQW